MQTCIYEIKSRTPYLQILTCLIFLVLFSKNLRFHWKGSSSEKNVIAEERLDGTDMDDIGNLEDSMMVKNLPEILTKRGSRKFYN